MYLGVVFTSNGTRNNEIDARISKVNAVPRELYRSVVTKWELSNSNTAKLSFFISVFFPILTYGNESMGNDWKSAISSTNGGDGIFRRIHCVNFATKYVTVKFVKSWISSNFLLLMERFQLRWFDHVTRMLHERLKRHVHLATRKGKPPDPNVAQGPGGVIHVRPCLVPSFCGTSRTLWDCCWPWRISSPLNATALITLPRRKTGWKMNEHKTE